MVQSPYLDIFAIRISKLSRSPLLGSPSVYCPEDSTRKVIQFMLAPCSKTGRRISSSDLVIPLMSLKSLVSSKQHSRRSAYSG